MTQQLPSKLKNRSPRRLTYEEFLNWDAENQHVEWVNGEVIEMSPVSFEHQQVRRFLLSILSAFLDAFEQGSLCDDPFQMKTGPELPGRAPDILFVANKHLARLKTNYLNGPADLVIEIISPGSRAVDRGEKFYEYEQGGVREYWLIDPIRKQAEFYQRGRDGHYRAISIAEDGAYHSMVMKGLWIDVNWLWKRPALVSVLKRWGLV